ARVLDAGCGIGLLAEKAMSRCRRYVAVDANERFAEILRIRMHAADQIEVLVADLNHYTPQRESFDYVAALNVIYQEGIDPDRVLPMLRDALRPGGVLVVSGPASAESFKRCERQLLADLDREGALKGKEEVVDRIREANDKLLSSRAHYWTGDE